MNRDQVYELLTHTGFGLVEATSVITIATLDGSARWGGFEVTCNRSGMEEAFTVEILTEVSSS